MRTLAALLLVLACVHASATSQFPERLLIDQREERLLTEPLAAYLANPEAFQRLKSFAIFSCTALRRGYLAEWELRDKELFLNKLFVDACGSKGRQVPLSTLIPGATGPVAANWFTGTLTIPQGGVVKVVHQGFEDKYDTYILIDITAGKVTGTRSRP